MSEEELETLLYTIVKKECGYSDNTKYEYEIKSIIQRCISQYLHNNKLKDIYVYDEIKDNCSYETTICW